MPHALLSPSGSERWINCPGSPNLENGCEQTKTNIYAFEGTIAHALAELILKHGPVNSIDDEIKTRIRFKCLKESGLKGKALTELTKLAYKIRIDRTMLGHVNTYIDEVKKHFPKYGYIYVEKRVKFYKTFGTVDCITFDGTRDTLYIYDLKYGKKRVKAKNNPQLAIYGLGALEVFRQFNPNLKLNQFKHISMNIFQPRISKPLSTWELSVKKFKSTWEPRLKAAMDNTEKQQNVFNAGPWCYYCRAWRICPTKKEKLQEEARKDFS